MYNVIREYKQWLTSHRQEEFITRGMTSRDKYETRAILERWRIGCYNYPGSSAVDIAQKMREEFIAKRIFAQENVDKIILAMKRINAEEESPDAGAQPIIRDNIAQFGRFQYAIPADRVMLLRLAAATKLPREQVDAWIVATAMRYASLVPGGQQWSVPSRVYDVLVTKYHVTIEGFASPFNSQLLRYICRGIPVHFCSLFPDLDKVFGSVGDFFRYDLEGSISVINPPYIEDILNRAVSKCIATTLAASKPTRMFIVVPKWTDAEFYHALVTTTCLETSMLFDKGSTYFEDVSGTQIRAQFGVHIFVISGGGMVADEEYATLRRAFTAK